MPEQEGEYESDAETHEPSYEEERRALDVLELLDDGDPFRHCLGGLGEDFRLKREYKVLLAFDIEDVLKLRELVEIVYWSVHARAILLVFNSPKQFADFVRNSVQHATQPHCNCIG